MVIATYLSLYESPTYAWLYDVTHHHIDMCYHCDSVMDVGCGVDTCVSTPQAQA